jgi:hypothetical protein
MPLIPEAFSINLIKNCMPYFYIELNVFIPLMVLG